MKLYAVSLFDIIPRQGEDWRFKKRRIPARLKNAGLIDNRSIDFSKTKTVRIASEEVGKDLWHQVYYVTFTKKAGDVIDTIVVHDASSEECSMSGVEVFVVSKHLNPEGK